MPEAKAERPLHIRQSSAIVEPPRGLGIDALSGQPHLQWSKLAPHSRVGAHQPRSCTADAGRGEFSSQGCMQHGVAHRRRRPLGSAIKALDKADKASRVLDKASKAGNKVLDKASKASKVLDKAGNKVLDKAGNKVNKVLDKAGNKASKVLDKASSGAWARRTLSSLTSWL